MHTSIKVSRNGSISNLSIPDVTSAMKYTLNHQYGTCSTSLRTYTRILNRSLTLIILLVLRKL